jgi:hypothetical protein
VILKEKICVHRVSLGDCAPTKIDRAGFGLLVEIRWRSDYHFQVRMTPIRHGFT